MNVDTMTSAEIAARLEELTEGFLFKHVPPSAQALFFEALKRLRQQDGGQKNDVPGYERLAEILEAAYDQVARGKGKERHANDQPFHEQKMQSISDLVGSPAGLSFQAIKKIVEVKNLPTLPAKRRELLGAINYIAGLLIYLEDREAESIEKHNAETAEDTDFSFPDEVQIPTAISPRNIDALKDRLAQRIRKDAGLEPESSYEQFCKSMPPEHGAPYGEEKEDRFMFGGYEYQFTVAPDQNIVTGDVLGLNSRGHLEKAVPGIYQFCVCAAEDLRGPAALIRDGEAYNVPTGEETHDRT